MSVKKNWENLFSAIGAPNDDFNDLIASYPTNQLSHDSSWSIFTTTSWIRKTLMKYPGILYDAVHAATCLGISVDCFNEESLQTFFNKSKYDGPFSKERNLWWKSKLLEVANNDMTDDEIFLPLRLGFSNFWVRIHNEPLLPSVCIWSNETPAECVCYILKKPVMFKYSIKYYPDNRPSVMDEARVSFKAIKTSDEVNFELFDSIGLEIIRKNKLG